MNWGNVKLIWRREIRDQLRDRRTLFVIGVLPLMIYPMMGIAFTRLSQFMRQNTAEVAVVGYEGVQADDQIPPLVEGHQFATTLLSDPALAERLPIERVDGDDEVLADARRRLTRGDLDVVLYFPPGFAERLSNLRELVRASEQPAAATLAQEPPRPVVYYDSTRDESQLAHSRIEILLDRWQGQIVRSNLVAGRLPVDITQPFRVEGEDVSSAQGRQAALWSKLLPFIVFICALTGAFYPAVDLCAGEKERGTLETLLTSPAQRSEIVGGKLLTVITFSIGSALCNLVSMAVTGHIILKQLNAMGATGAIALAPPSLSAIGWLLLALVPMAVFFSAASLALAALARSTKEGQYYLMPLFLVCMPLMMLPLLPGVELTLATSLIPVSGMVLLMQAAMEGRLLAAGMYLAPVAAVTTACCVLAIRWATDQFRQESVLFRDTENFNLAIWLRHAYVHRPATPRLAAAVVLFCAILLAQFSTQGLGFDITQPAGFIKLLLFTQLACILLPTLVVAQGSATSLRQTFLLAARVPWAQTALALLLAVAIQPLAATLMEGVVRLIPLSADFERLLERLALLWQDREMSLATALLVMAVLPAICEELAFRGVMLTGLRSRMSAGWAVVLSAVLFGLAHASALQQTISAGFLGLLLGYLAIKTSQLTPCVAFHMGYNGLQLLRTTFADSLADMPYSNWVFRPSETPVVGLGFTTPMVVLSAAAAIALLWQIGHRRCRTAGTVGLPGAARSTLTPTAPAEESGA